jgi:hypothetical protein
MTESGHPRGIVLCGGERRMKVNQKFGEKMIGDTQQYDELSRLYSSFGDKELLSLARDMDDLTETAQQVLKSELGRRGLEAAATAALPAEPLHDDLADSPLQAFAAMAPDEQTLLARRLPMQTSKASSPIVSLAAWIQFVWWSLRKTHSPPG